MFFQYFGPRKNARMQARMQECKNAFLHSCILACAPERTYVHIPPTVFTPIGIPIIVAQT